MTKTSSISYSFSLGGTGLLIRPGWGREMIIRNYEGGAGGDQLGGIRIGCLSLHRRRRTVEARQNVMQVLFSKCDSLSAKSINSFLCNLRRLSSPPAHP